MIYTTKDGDRLDLLAWKYLGTPKGYYKIIAANTPLPLHMIKLPSGIKLTIPERANAIR